MLLAPLAVRAEEDQRKAKPSPAIEMDAPFADNAVLQRQMKLPVWGWSKPGTTATVEFAGQKQTAQVAKDGKWLLTLDPLEANAKPQEMVITESPGKGVSTACEISHWLAAKPGDQEGAAAANRQMLEVIARIVMEAYQ
jgi:hypothetical protein